MFKHENTNNCKHKHETQKTQTIVNTTMLKHENINNCKHKHETQTHKNCKHNHVQTRKHKQF